MKLYIKYTYIFASIFAINMAQLAMASDFTEQTQLAATASQPVHTLPEQYTTKKYSVSVDKQIDEWKNLFTTYMKRKLIPTSPFPELESKLLEGYQYITYFLGEDITAQKLGNTFYAEEKEICAREGLTLELFNAIMLRLSFLANSRKIENPIAETLLEGAKLYDDSNWQKLDHLRDFQNTRHEYLESHMYATLFVTKGGLKYERFIDSFLNTDFPFGLASIAADSTEGPHGGIVNTSPLFYIHDRGHWRGFVSLSHDTYKDTSLLPTYKNIWNHKSFFSVDEKRIVETTLFTLLREAVEISVHTTNTYSANKNHTYGNDFTRNLLAIHEVDAKPSPNSNILKAIDSAYSNQIRNRTRTQAYQAFEEFISKLNERTWGHEALKIIDASTESISLGYEGSKNSYSVLSASAKLAFEKTSDNPNGLFESWKLTSIAAPECTEYYNPNDLMHSTPLTMGEVYSHMLRILNEIEALSDKEKTVEIASADYNYKINVQDEVTLLRYVYGKDYFSENENLYVPEEKIQEGFQRLFTDFFNIMLK